MSTPLVSILIPCYNAGPWLRQTLESALAQTWRAKEIIVVDDGSTDDSPHLALEYADRGVRLISQKNAGQSAAFNRAVAEARGDYLEFLDADDLLAPTKLEEQLARLRTLPSGWVATCGWARFHQSTEEAVPDPGPVTGDLDPVDWLVKVWSAETMMHGAAWLVPADLVRRAGGWDERLSLINDFEFFSRLLLEAAGVAHCPATLTYYRSGLPGSLSAQKSDRAWASAFLSTRLGTERLLARENSPRTRAAAAACLRNLYFAAYPDVPDLRADALLRLHGLGEALGTPPGGRKFRLLSRLLGWRAARRLQRRRFL